MQVLYAVYEIARVEAAVTPGSQHPQRCEVIDTIFAEIENGLSTYEIENKRQRVIDEHKKIYIPINVVRRLIAVRKDRCCASHTSARSEQEIRADLLEDLWQTCLINGVNIERNGELLSLPSEKGWALVKIVKRIYELRLQQSGGQ